MNRTVRFLALLGVAALFAVLPKVAQAQNGTLTCNSDDMKYHTCSIPPGSNARMVRQRSGSPCVEGRTYGTRNGQIWVNNGCRADFEIVSNGRGYGNNGGNWGRDRDHDRDRDRDHDRDGYRGDNRDNNGPGNGYRGGQPSVYYGHYGDGKSTCSAGQGGQGRTFCQTDGAFRDAMIQNSNGQCVRGRNWDVDRQYGLWVSGSCSGTWKIQR